jgi:hypothetical protein
MNQVDARRTICRLWRESGGDGKTMNEAYSWFQGTLRSDHPKLLAFRSSGDPWPLVQLWLTGHTIDTRDRG